MSQASTFGPPSVLPGDGERLPLPAARARLLVPAAVGIAVVACAALLAGIRHPPAAPARSEHGPALERLQAACSQAMLNNSCRVMSAPAAGTASVVFIAGVGPVDGQVYEALRASGDAMCATVRQACVREWDGGQCRTARAMWSVEPPTRP